MISVRCKFCTRKITSSVRPRSRRRKLQTVKENASRIARHSVRLYYRLCRLYRYVNARSARPLQRCDVEPFYWNRENMELRAIDGEAAQRTQRLGHEVEPNSTAERWRTARHCGACAIVSHPSLQILDPDC